MSSQVTIESTRRLFSEAELEDIQGKMRCFETLMRHPRKNLPELKPCIEDMTGYYASVMDCKDIMYTEESRTTFEYATKLIKLHEDTLIRVILGGQDAEDVTKDQKRRHCEAILNGANFWC